MKRRELLGYRCGCGFDLDATRPARCPSCGWDFGASGEHPSWDLGWCFVLSVYSRWTGKHFADHEMLLPSRPELDAAFGPNPDRPGMPRECYSVTRWQRSMVQSLAQRRCNFLLHHYEIELRSISASTPLPKFS